jgi:hypothetical protein
MITDRLHLGFHWRDFPETPFLACATNIVRLVVIGRKLQFVASFLPVGGVSGVDVRAYWASWIGEGWVFICLELQFDKVYCTYGSGKKALDQTWRCISDSLLAYRLKVLPAKTVHVTVTIWSRVLPENQHVLSQEIPHMLSFKFKHTI